MKTECYITKLKKESDGKFFVEIWADDEKYHFYTTDRKIISDYQDNYDNDNITEALKAATEICERCLIANHVDFDEIEIDML